LSENQTVKVRLDSWKEIAGHLGRDVRTVIRWEKKGLPIHRVPGGQRQAVFAYKHELDTWLEMGETLTQTDILKSETLIPSVAGEIEIALQGTTPAVESAKETSEPEPIIQIFDQEPDNAGSRDRTIRAHKWKLSAASVSLIGLVWLLNFVHSQTSARIHTLPLARITDDGRAKVNLRTDGKTLYFNEFEVNRRILMSVSVDGGSIHRIKTPFANVELQDISSDGQNLLVTPSEGNEEEKQLWIVSAQGRASRRVGDVLCRFARWSPDGRRIACIAGTTVILVESDGSNPRAVGSFPSPPMTVTWSPRGDRLGLVLQETAARTRLTWEIAISKDETETVPGTSKLTFGKNCCVDWAWTRNGKNVVYTQFDANRIPRLFIKPQDGPLTRWFKHETELPVNIGTIETIAPGKSDNSLYLLIGNIGRGELLKCDAKQQAPQAILPGLSGRYLSFSRDGKWIAYASTLDQSLWRSRIDGSDAIQLVKPPMSVEFSAWSPDGRQIAFMGKTPERPWRIFLMSPDGGDPQEAIAGNDNQGAPTWSPDGSALVYGNVDCHATQACWIQRLDLSARKVERLPRSHGLRTARWSPNGKWIAALQNDSHELLLFNVRTKRWISLADSITGDDINWSRDSQSIYANSPQGPNPVIEKVRIRDGKRTTVVSLASLQNIPGQIDFWFGLAPDNSPILLHLFNATDVYVLEWTDH